MRAKQRADARMPFQQLPHGDRDGLGLVPSSQPLGRLFDQGNDIRAIDGDDGRYAGLLLTRSLRS
jgi:hypothetical protein